MIVLTCYKKFSSLISAVTNYFLKFSEIMSNISRGAKKGANDGLITGP